MVQYLSGEWLSMADAAIASDDKLTSAATDADVVIRYEVAGTPVGKVAYDFWFKDGAAGLDPDPEGKASTTFSLDYETAVEVAKGELSAQAAFMQGRLKLAGDVTLLINQYRVIDGLADVLSGLRSKTDF